MSSFGDYFRLSLSQRATLRKIEKLRKRDSLLTGEGGGDVREPNHLTAGKPGPPEVIQYFAIKRRF